MVFQSLLSSTAVAGWGDTSASSMMASSLPGMKKASRSLENLATMGKPDVIGSVRTFNNLSPERANRRALDDAGENWSVVGTCADGPGSSKAEEDGVLPDALDALMQGEQLSPIWRTQRNYGTFTRASFTYSAAVTDTSAASQKRSRPANARRLPRRHHSLKLCSGDM